MTTPVRLYQQEMHKNLGYFATWMPGSSIELGDIGVVESGIFRKDSSLRDLGIPCVSGSPGQPQTLNYSSWATVNVDAEAGVAVEAVAKAKVSITFSRNGAFIFQATEAQNLDLKNRVESYAGILKKCEQGAWKKEWLVIDSVMSAKCATIVVSQEESSTVVLSAASRLLPGVLALADPKLGLTISDSRGKVVSVIAGEGLCPLYLCARVKDQWFQDPVVIPVRGTSGQGHAAEAMARVSISELLNT